MPEVTGRRPNLSLREERLHHCWSQVEVADRIGTTPNNVSRWELGTTSPTPYFRAKLCDLFGKTAEELGLLSRETKPVSQEHQRPIAVFAETTPLLWNVPFRRNPFFTGRTEVLLWLRATLSSPQSAALTPIQAISGLGGIGKTHITIEYAYRYRDQYQAVFWVRADTHEVLVSDLVSLATLLDLPEQDNHDQRRLVASVKRWLNTHRNWLLILDNVEDPAALYDFLPSVPGGHIVLTTRSQTIGTLAEGIELEQMHLQEGALLLLRRAKLVARDAHLEAAPQELLATAQTLTGILGGLPLALDQAGAYVEETGCGLSDYLDCYRTRQAILLSLRGTGVTDHPAPVMTTFLLAFERVEQSNPIAADLLRFCAFLHPDAIPEELFTQGAAELTPVLAPLRHDPLALDAAIKHLRRFSLVRRSLETHTLTIHRLVQAVLKEGMDERLHWLWVERSIQAVNQVFPDTAELLTWPRCQRYLPHALACALLIEQWCITSAAAGRLLHQTGVYLRECGQHAQAQPLLEKALAIREQTLGGEHPAVANSLNSLGDLAYYQGRYSQAASWYQRALAIQEQALGSQHSDLAESLSNLALVYCAQGKYAEAEPLYLRALAISEHVVGPMHANVAYILNNLGNLYRTQGKYVQAEPLYLRALAIREQILPEHPRVAESLANVGVLYNKQGKYREAERCLTRAHTLYQQVLGSQHPTVAALLSELAELCRGQGRYSQAEHFLQEALALYEKMTGLEHHRPAQCLNSLAELYRIQGDYTKAESLCQRALAIRQRVLGPEHLHVASSLHTLGRLSYDQGKHLQAEQLFQQARGIYEQTVGPEHPDLALLLTHLAELAYIQGKYTQAELLCQQALAIQTERLGAEHPDTTCCLHTLAKISQAQGRDEQAELLCQHTLDIREQVLGADHPLVAEICYTMADLSHRQGSMARAERLYQRALAIWERRLGADHPQLLVCLESYASLLRQTNQESHAVRCEIRAREIRAKRSQRTAGEGHGDLHHWSDPLKGFLEVCCELHPQRWSRASDLWEAYQQWVHNQKELRPLSRHAFAHELEAKGCRPARTSTMRIWRGITLVGSADGPDDAG